MSPVLRPVYRGLFLSDEERLRMYAPPRTFLEQIENTPSSIAIRHGGIGYIPRKD